MVSHPSAPESRGPEAWRRAVESVRQLSEIGEGLSIVVISGPAFRAPEALQRLADEAAAGRRILWHRLDRQGADFDFTLGEGEEEPVFLAVHGLEYLPERRRAEVETELNLSRDSLAGRRALIVLWVPLEELDGFRRRCADFFHWRSALLQLGKADVALVGDAEAKRRLRQFFEWNLPAPEGDFFVERQVALADGSPEAFFEWGKIVNRGWLTGLAGSGKTAALEHLAARWLRDPLFLPEMPDDRPLPILVKLREIDHWVDLTEAEGPGVLAEMPGLAIPVDSGHLMSWAESGDLFLLFDGMDEVPGEARDSVRRWIFELGRRFPQTKIVVSSRTHDDPMADWSLATLLPLSSDQIGAIALRRLPSAVAQQLLESLAHDDRSENLARSPLLLSFLIRWAENNNTWPLRRLTFYRAAARTLMVDRDANRDLLPLRSLESPETLHRKLSRLGLYGLEHRKTSFLSAEVWFASNLSNDSLRFLVDRTGLLTREADAYAFSHRGFLEYFAAEGLLELGVSPSTEKLLIHLDDPEWRSVIVMAMGELCQLFGPPFLWELLWPEEALQPEVRLDRAALTFECAAEAGLEEQVFDSYRAKALSWLDAAPEGPEARRLRGSLRHLNSVQEH